MSKVFVGMSGGVDSSVAALLLTEQGHDVIGVYMKNWSRDLPGMKCPWADDLADAKRVAVRLGIPFEVWDFEAEYREKVVEYMLTEFRAGHTPNPDIMCNQEIKFKLFYERAMGGGANFIATGHYARVVNTSDTPAPKLLRAVDENKDQTYFLYRISNEALQHTLFPIGEMLKPDVKKLAEAKGLHNAYKKESMGVCFVGEVGMKDFLKEYIDIKPGEIREAETEKVLGYHEGAIFYTIGQRHGLYLSGEKGAVSDGLPYYIVAKDLDRNLLYVSKNLNHELLWTKKLALRDVVWRNAKKEPAEPLPQGVRSLSRRGVAAPARADASGERAQGETGSEAPLVAWRVQQYSAQGLPEATAEDESEKPVTTSLSDPSRGQTYCELAPRSVQVRLRHRAPLIPAAFDGKILHFEREIKRPASGQSAVFYDGITCLGGGIIV